MAAGFIPADTPLNLTKGGKSTAPNPATGPWTPTRHTSDEVTKPSSRREAASRPTLPRRRPNRLALDGVQRAPQPPDPTAQLELLPPEEVG